MSEEEKPGGFQRDRAVDNDAIVGARWWNQSLIEADKSTGRRSVLKLLGIGGLTVATCGIVCSDSCEDDADAYTFLRKNSLELQKQYGWDFGAADVPLVFDGVATTPFDPASIATIEQDLAPTTHAALHVPTLLQAPLATPSARPAEETVPFEPLAKKLKPILTPAMTQAYARGELVARLLAGHDAPATVVVDLPGPEAIAFAAGAASTLEPVFLFDNWPHPQGVVPSHLVLAAALYYQPLFLKARAVRPPTAMPLFVLDHARLSSYVDASGKFDNRYLARMPSLVALKNATGGRVQWLLHIVAGPHQLPEQEDLNEPFVAYDGGGVPVRALSLDSLTIDDTGKATYATLATNTTTTEQQFYVDYAVVGGVTGDTVGGSGSHAPFATAFGGKTNYRPTFRTTNIHGPTATGFGTTEVALAAATGAVLGSRYDRRGSWNRMGG